jgi:hypothetical protein
MPDVSRIARWSQLGIYRVLAEPSTDGNEGLSLHLGLELACSAGVTGLPAEPVGGLRLRHNRTFV